ncbi:MAG: aspartate aminotransferase [Omnitrophica WOR_2 bacterium GWF2_38_59]|nr:MAG: aspartate aminotransferase [Omnitrophica WOR_2 bacterium GWA2_37_7]OGX25215.1 MAG: aspartate aminotransferase [Omnitrophica WOR_2 bacterium GWF2_38_59]OGX47887.1 MAG: aspartate aminotransferase [Omnitrophica WOR_2 bacterium RIFOXYA2_FULL_38_17]OGX53545.1 MAG: aspartate aminotransferase [Omnitrophica WOR_2 bacterium RIFOXYA12_FULL_38_10]OGX56224.1 MAG: aspartate aminotransferase [Omnitrophica WOR_2 bacterium RIFOXYC2_FULL_38_12]OGX60271.1 MAG: aspartate aminotransferase [Omnitrophica WO
MLKVNGRVKDLEASSTLAITARAKELRAKGFDVVNFAAGEPDFGTPQHIKYAAIKAICDDYTKYTPSVGAIELRQAICDKFKRDNNLVYKPSQIAVSCGAKHSLFCIIQVLTDVGEEVLIPTPYWVSYPEMVKLSGATSKFIETSADTNFKITAKQLEKSITDKTKLLILNSPSNPTGMLYSKPELQSIADICVKNNVYVISDEIYEQFVYGSEECVSIASLGKEIYDLTITVNGVSKSAAMTGWRIGYCAASEEILGYITKLQDHSTSCPSSISQKAALQSLSETKEYFTEMRKEFKKRRDLITSAFDEVDEISYIMPQGAFYLFCDFSKLGESLEVAKNILNDVNVAMIPGDSFGSPGFMRLSFATSCERIAEGTKRIKEWIKKQA